jgi:hypothetical protein
MNRPARVSTLTATVLLLVGLCLIFVGQRILQSGALDDAANYAGAALVALAVALRVRAFSASGGDVRGVQALLLGVYAGCVASLGLYALSTDAGVARLGLSGDAAAHAQGALSVLWPSALLVSLFAILFIELVYVRMPIPESVELRRVRTALHAGLSLGLSIVFVLSMNYVATARDVRKDVSYFRTTEPSATTRQMLEKLDQKLKVILFFQQGSDVLGQVEPYFRSLAGVSKKIGYQVVDVALAPQLASKHKVRENGNVLLLRGEGDAEKSETLRVGDDLGEARATLRKLDREFQASFIKLVRPERMIYLTVGHGERNAKQSEVLSPDGTGILEDLLRRLNLKTKPLGMAEGLGNLVPTDASAVMVVGPSEKFLPEEANALLAYAQKGGKLFLMIDPEQDVGLAPLLEGLGVNMMPGVVNSENNHMARAHNQSDRGIVFSNLYSSHPTVTTVSRHQREVATVLVNGGALALASSPVQPKPKVTFPLRSERGFWRDLNGNFSRDANEPQESLNLMAAVTLNPGGDKKKADKSGADAAEGRAVIIGDGDVITNKVAQNNGNLLLVVDSLGWLVGNEDLTGESTSEEDMAIEHSREQDKVWFYATTFAVPVPIVFAGAWIARRRRRRTGGAS